MVQHVEGKDKGELMLYALSTCIWCRKTRKLLEELGVGFSFVDVDLLEEEKAKEIMAKVKKWNPSGSFPTLVVNNESSINGFDEDKIRKAVE